MKDFTEQEYEQMNRYIDGTLSDGERTAVEKRLLNDPDFAAEVAWLRKFFVNYQHVVTEDKVREIHAELAKEGLLATKPVEHVYWTPWRMAMAASVVLVLGIGIWYWQSLPPTQSGIAGNNQGQGTSTTSTTSSTDTTSSTAPASNSATTPKVVIPDPGPSFNQLATNYGKRSPKGIGDVPAELTKAVTSYEQGGKQLEEAIAVLKKPVLVEPKEEYGASKGITPQAQENKSTADYRHFYLGLSYLKNGQAKSALTALNQIEGDNLTQTVQWYKALCYVQLGQTTNAKQVLTQIQNEPGHPYQTEASKLMASLPASAR
ncbi:tetratricopeptide repeat protein [Spirosoma litoris]